MNEALATKAFVRVELTDLRHRTFTVHVASLLGLALLILFRT